MLSQSSDHNISICVQISHLYRCALDTPINRYFYVSSGTECIAKPNKGFEFSSWTQNLAQNSTITINASTTSGSPWTSFLDIFGAKADDPAATLSVTRFGNFTAYFKALPPAIPSEYWIPLYGIIVSTIVGWSIPSIISWSKSKTLIRRLNYYHRKIASVYDDGKLDESDIESLNSLSKNISNAYAEGKISNEHYTNLKNEISVLYQEIFKKRIESITVPNTEAFRKIKNDITDAYANGKITELHYNLLNEKISDMSNDK
jgi:uncharacterized membrane protein